MGALFHGGLFGFIARLNRPAAIDSDAELLDRYVRTADESAFAGLVRRHGLMVLATCRRRLREEADVEDAFQAAFLALATSASSIGRRESLPGWLYRVAYLTSLKAAGRRARRAPAALPTMEVPMPDPPLPAPEAAELKGIIDAELASLPDRFRSVVVLCLIEGRTNVEAATILGIPVGTVDSRLSVARKRLCDKLTRRGVAVGVGATLGQMLGGPVDAAEGPAIEQLYSRTIPAVLAEAAGPGGGDLPPAVTDLARGVTFMTTTKLRLLVAVGIAMGILGGSAAGIYFATAADQPKPSVSLSDKAGDPPPASGKAPAPDKAAEPEALNVDSLLATSMPALAGASGIPLRELFELIEQKSDVIIRIDVAAFRRLKRLGGDDGLDVETFLEQIYNTKALLARRAEKIPLRDVLSDVLAQIRLQQPCSYQVRGNQIVIVPAYVPPYPPGVNPLGANTEDDTPVLDAWTLQEQIYGGVVSVSADRKPLSAIISDLRKQTGANIVLDPRCDSQDKKAVLSVTLNDVRLYDALRVLADMAELKMVYAGNVYYVTTPANAILFQPPAPPRPAAATPPAPRAPGPGAPPQANPNPGE